MYIQPLVVARHPIRTAYMNLFQTRWCQQGFSTLCISHSYKPLHQMSPWRFSSVCLFFFPNLFPWQPYGWHLHAQPRTKRKLLQSTSSGPYSPLTVAYNGKICILFKAKRLAIRYRNHTFLDLTERVFGPNASVETKGSVCSKEKATYEMTCFCVWDLFCLYCF